MVSIIKTDHILANGNPMKKYLSTFALMTLVACSTPTAQQITPGPVSSASISTTKGFTADLNAFRASQGRGAMRQNPILTRAAQAHAEDMAQRNYFSHKSPGGPNGDNLMQRAASAGCTLRAGAENIASGQTSESQVLTGWQNSPGHRANLLGPRYTEYGLGRSGNIWVMKLSSGC
jgi:uncharacterized protein YkwD